jgi:hypothetical protein
MNVAEIERNFLGPKAGSSRVLRGMKCPKKVPGCAPQGPKIGRNLVKCPLLQGLAYSGWRPEIWSGPENQPGACAPTKMARNDCFRKSMGAGLSRPEVPARVVSY